MRSASPRPGQLTTVQRPYHVPETDMEEPIEETCGSIHRITNSTPFEYYAAAALRAD
jgi:hypothetical protein